MFQFQFEASCLTIFRQHMITCISDYCDMHRLCVGLKYGDSICIIQGVSCVVWHLRHPLSLSLDNESLYPFMWWWRDEPGFLGWWNFIYCITWWWRDEPAFWWYESLTPHWVKIKSKFHWLVSQETNRSHNYRTSGIKGPSGHFLFVDDVKTTFYQ